MIYRKEIDGLRAIAVLSVIFFHSGFKFPSGGFLGVDVFFVISGYLISSIIFQELEEGKFSFRNFYERRARRILPPLFAMLLFCLPLAWLYLTPADMDGFSQSLTAVSTFSSNFHFAKTTGYFDGPAELRPLLHTWSLAVEEQFYIVFPIIALIFYRFGKKSLAALLVVIFICSLVFAQWGVTARPEAKFYLVTTRAWELLAGVFAGFLRETDKPITPARKYTDEAASFCGLLILVVSLFAVDGSAPSSNLYNLLSVLGTFLVITFSSSSNISGKILGNKAFVFVGLMSYSAYLWHQPLFAFTRLKFLSEPSNIYFIGLTLLTFALAFLSWKYIEAPFRNKIRISAKTVYVVSGLFTMFFISLGAWGNRTDGLLAKNLRSADFVSLASYNNYLDGKSEEDYWRKGCFNLRGDIGFFSHNNCDAQIFPGRPRVFLLGDSHSAYLGQYLRDFLISKKFNLSQFSTAYCTPLSLRDKRGRCQEINHYILDRISQERPETVIIFANHLLWAESKDYGEAVPYDEFLRNKTDEIKKLGVSKILVVGQMPTWEISLPNVLIQNYVLHDKKVPDRSASGVVQDSIQWDTKLGAQNYAEGVYYLSLRKLLCDSNGCLTKVGPDLSRDLLVYDYGHLTKPGAKYVTEALISPFF